MSKNLKTQSSKAFEALNDYILVEPERAESEVGGVMLANTKKQKVGVGTVISAGPGRKLADGSWAMPGVKAGDKIIFNPHLLQEIKVGGETWKIITSNAIYGRITK